MPLRVAIVARLDEEDWALLRQVPGVELVDLSDWAWAGAAARQEGDPCVRQELARRLEDVEVALLMGPGQPLLEHAPALRWVQLPFVGLEQLAGTPARERGILVTNARGLNARSVAEWGLTLMLALAKQLPHYLRQQASQRWEPRQAPTLSGMTVGLVGLGAIGGELARFASALGLRVIAIRRSGPQPPPAGVSWVGGPGDLPRLLAEADWVVLAVPATAETHRLIGAEQLCRMKPTAWLVNLARGALVDEAALVTALREGWIAGAALDVFEQEPLPAASPLWQLENVIITPHVAGTSPGYFHQVVALFCENLRRYLAGEPLLNRCDLERGY